MMDDPKSNDAPPWLYQYIGWPSNILHLVQETIDAAKGGDQTAIRHLLGFFSKCIRKGLPPPESLALYVADEFDRQVLPPPEMPGVDLLSAMLGSDSDVLDEVIRSRYTSKRPGPFFGLADEPRGRPQNSPAVDIARAMAVDLEKKRHGVGNAKARELVSERFHREMLRTLANAQKARDVRHEESVAKLQEWRERIERENVRELAAWEDAGRPGCMSVVLCRDYGQWLAGETIRVDPVRAEWLQEHGYAAQILETVKEAAEAAEKYRTDKAKHLTKANSEQPLTWGEEPGEIVRVTGK